MKRNKMIKRMTKTVLAAIFAGSFIAPSITQAADFDYYNRSKVNQGNLTTILLDDTKYTNLISELDAYQYELDGKLYLVTDVLDYLNQNPGVEPTDPTLSSQLQAAGISYESLSAVEKTDTANFFGNQIQNQPVAKGIYDAMRLNIDILKTGTEPISFTVRTGELSLSQFDEQMQAGMDAFDRDYSEVFWIDFQKLGISYRYNSANQAYEGKIQMQRGYKNYFVKEYSSQAEVEQDIHYINSTVQKVVSEANGSDYHKLQYFHDYIVDKVQYNAYLGTSRITSKAWEATSGLYYGSTDKTNVDNPVCEGYARALKELCDAAGIPNVLVSGLSQGEGHMWNYVQVDGDWYAIDATWDDPVYSYTPSAEDIENNQYVFFMKGSNNFPDHTNRGEFVSGGHKFSYPTLSTTDYVVTQ